MFAHADAVAVDVHAATIGRLLVTLRASFESRAGCDHGAERDEGGSLHLGSLHPVDAALMGDIGGSANPLDKVG